VDNELNANAQETVYKVVMNQEEQFALWPANLIIPAGWSETGQSGTKAECLAYVKEAWTDLTPLSLRQA
jgi:MbtH protein